MSYLEVGGFLTRWAIIAARGEWTKRGIFFDFLKLFCDQTTEYLLHHTRCIQNSQTYICYQTPPPGISGQFKTTRTGQDKMKACCEP